MTDESDNPFLTIPEAAQLLRVNRRTLDNLRWQEEGPPFRRHGGRIVYNRNELLAWSEQRRARTPPDSGQKPTTARDGDTGSRPLPPSVPESKRSNAPLEHQP